MNDRGVRCANKSKIAGGGTQPRRRARPPGAPRAGTAKSVQICSFVLIDCHGLLRKPRNDITGQPICHCEAGAHTGCGNLKLPNLHEPVRFLRPPLRGRGRLRAPPVADEASKKEWQNQGDWQAGFACADRAADSTGWGMPHPYSRLSKNICRAGACPRPAVELCGAHRSHSR